MKGLIVDLFAGAGGASVGIEAAMGRSVDIAINHSPVALSVHAANHPRTRHLTADIRDVKPLDATRGEPVYVLWASPDCTHHSNAKGGPPRCQNMRSLAWVVVDWAKDVRPSIIFLENVPEFRSWGPLDENGKPTKSALGETFIEWCKALEDLGYVVEYKILTASHYGTPTSRKRLFLVARCDGLPICWPATTHGPALLPFKSAADCIDWNLPCPSIFNRVKPLADATLRRIAQGIKRFVVEHPSPFIRNVSGQTTAPTLIQRGYGEREGQSPRVLNIQEPLGTIVAGGVKHVMIAAFLAKHYTGVTGVPLDGRPLDTITTKDHHALVSAFLTAYYGGPDDAGQVLGDPLRTITTKDRFALVTVNNVQHVITDIGMRMLEPHELLRAQFGRYALFYDLSTARNKTDKVRLIGNSVCPEVAQKLVAANAVSTQLRGAA